MRISVIVCLLLSGSHSAFAGELNSVAIPTENGALAAHLGVHQFAFKLLVDHPVTYSFELHEDGEVVSASTARVALVTEGAVPFEVSFSRTAKNDAWLVTVAHAGGTSQDTVDTTLAGMLAFPGPVSKRMPIDENGRLVLAAEVETSPDGTPLPVSIDGARRAVVMRLEVNGAKPQAENLVRADTATDEGYAIDLNITREGEEVASQTVYGATGGRFVQPREGMQPPSYYCRVHVISDDGDSFWVKVTAMRNAEAQTSGDGTADFDSDVIVRYQRVGGSGTGQVTIPASDPAQLPAITVSYRIRRQVGVEQALTKFDKVIHSQSN